MSDSDDPFLVTSPLGITSILRTIVKQKILVHMHFGHRDQAIITTVLDVDTEQERLVVDAASDNIFNQRLVHADKIHFDAQVNKVRVQFHTGQAHPLTFDQRQAFWLPYPETLRRMQRRDNFRIDIPVSTPLLCRIPRKDDVVVTLPVKDISAGGIALLDHNEEITENVSALLGNCELELDDIGTVVTTLQIRRIGHQMLGGSTPVKVIACSFYNPPLSDTIMIQNYIGRLDRMLNARRRGFD